MSIDTVTCEKLESVLVREQHHGAMTTTDLAALCEHLIKPGESAFTLLSHASRLPRFRRHITHGEPKKIWGKISQPKLWRYMSNEAEIANYDQIQVANAKLARGEGVQGTAKNERAPLADMPADLAAFRRLEEMWGAHLDEIREINRKVTLLLDRLNGPSVSDMPEV